MQDEGLGPPSIIRRHSSGATIESWPKPQAPSDEAESAPEPWTIPETEVVEQEFGLSSILNTFGYTLVFIGCAFMITGLIGGSWLTRNLFGRQELEE